MAIDSLFTKEEQIAIIWIVRRMHQEYEHEKTPLKRRYYLTKIAPEYHLALRVENQMRRQRDLEMIQRK